MFRTVYITKGEKIGVHDNWLIITADDMDKRVPLEDIQTIVFDNSQAEISLYTLNALSSNGTNVIICDNKHMPNCNVLSFTQHYRPYGVLKRQLALTKEFKADLWRVVVRAKINNQADALSFIGEDARVVSRLRELANEVQFGDIGNREAIAAKLFFRNFYGYDFTRFEDDIINKAMNYGYTIIRSIVARSLCIYGYHCALGIHHINENNAFNLADDLMEPLRPTVDLWVNKHIEELGDELNKDNKVGLINLSNQIVVCTGKNMKLYNAVDKYISSFTSAINDNNVLRLECPKLKGYD